MKEAFIGEIGIEPSLRIGVAGIDPIAETAEEVIFMLLGTVRVLLLLLDLIENLFYDF